MHCEFDVVRPIMQIEFAVQHDLCGKVCFVWVFLWKFWGVFVVVGFLGFFGGCSWVFLTALSLWIYRTPAKYLRKFFLLF